MTVAAPVKPRRPWFVTVIVVLVYISGVVDVLLGILAIFARYLPGAEAEGIALPITILGAAVILIGLGTVALGSGAARGSRFARGAITVLLLASAVIAAIGLVLDPDDGPAGLIVQLVVCAVVALPLWLGPSRRFFAAAAPAQG